MKRIIFTALLTAGALLAIFDALSRLSIRLLTKRAYVSNSRLLAAARKTKIPASYWADGPDDERPW